MADIEHKDIVDAQRHEPKGASTALQGHTYVSDGAGSGAWEPPKIQGQTTAAEKSIPVSLGSGSIGWKLEPRGWGFYKDNNGTQVINTSETKLLINGNGSTSSSAYLPKEILGISELWDSSTNKITPISTGDTYGLRVDLPITAESGAPAQLTISLDIGGGATPTIVIVEKSFSIGKTPPYALSSEMSLFSLDTFLANGGQIFVKVDAGTITVTNPGLFLERHMSGSF